MIPRGHKIIVLASSTNKSGAKVRKGSIGFVAGIGATHEFPRQGMYVTPAKIVFTRYGHESIQRNETKFVTLIHPVVKPLNIQHPQRTLNKLVISSIDMTDRIKKHFETEGVTGRPTVSIVIDRLRKDTNLLNNLNDLKAWTSSVLQNGTLHPVVMAPEHSNLNVAKEELIDGFPEFKTRLKNCILHRKQSNEFIDTISDNHALKALLIKKLRGFLTLQARKDILSYKEATEVRWVKNDTLFPILWYFLDNNIKFPSTTEKLYGIKSHITNVETWMQLFASIK
jgi:hypothetical protein